jgi:hypothetical protein
MTDEQVLDELKSESIARAARSAQLAGGSNRRRNSVQVCRRLTFAAWSLKPILAAYTPPPIEETSPSPPEDAACDVCGRTLGGPAGVLRDPAVEQTHHALDDGDVGPEAAVPKQRADQVLAHQYRIQVASRSARGKRVVTRVDDVGADLERRDAVPARAGRPSARWPPWSCRCPMRVRRSRRPGRSFSSRAVANMRDTPTKLAGLRLLAGIFVTIRCRAGPCARCPSGA